MRAEKQKHPPVLASWILQKLTDDNINYSFMGDLEQNFHYLLEQKGLVKAVSWYWGQAIKALFPFIGNKLYWSYAMFKSYLKIAYRNLRRQKGYSLINITGLTIGITCCTLIFLYVQHENSYDSFHEKADNIYRIDWYGNPPQTRTPYPMSHSMVADFPEVVSAVSISPIWGPGLTKPTFRVEYEEKAFDETNLFSADTTFFDVFSFKLLKGDPKQALIIPNGVIITEDMAQKYFGDEEPVGKIVKINQVFDFTVTGVLQNIPENSHFDFDFLVSYVTMRPFDETGFYLWADFGHYNYLVLAEGADPKELAKKLPVWSTQYINWSPQNFKSVMSGERFFKLQPLTDIHLHSNIKWELEKNGNMTTIYIFSASAIFVLIIACVNYMNLATALSIRRSKEIGMRKTLGAKRNQLIWQFLAESVLFSFIAIILAMLAVSFFMPQFNALTSKNLTLDLFSNTSLLFALSGMTLFVGLFSGSYPAFFVSAFKPTKALKAGTVSESGSKSMRKLLVVFQFATAITLIAGTTVVYDQLHYLKTQSLGFNSDEIVSVPIKNSRLRSMNDEIKTELAKIPGVVSASSVSNIPGKRFNQNAAKWVGGDDSVNLSEMSIDYDFFTTLDIDLADGRNFQSEIASDSSSGFIINEAAARQFDWNRAVDKQIRWEDDNKTIFGKIIGVTKDFHFQSLHSQITPLIFMVNPHDFNYMLIKIRTDATAETLASIEEVWTSFDKIYTFEYSFLNRNFEENYKGEERLGRLFAIFSMLSVFIGCLGLFGLTAFTVQQKTKEIGIRKVLGATVPGILMLMSREFTRLVIIANIIAWPLSYYLMSKWLEGFAYRTDISMLAFLLSGLAAFVIALLTVSFHAIRSANANPVDSLKSE